MKPFKILLATVVVVASAVALAHGNEDRAIKENPVVREQKNRGSAGDAKAAKRIIEVKIRVATIGKRYGN